MIDKRYKKDGLKIVDKEIIPIGNSRGVELHSADGCRKIILPYKENEKLCDTVQEFVRANRNCIDRMRKYLDIYMIYEAYIQDEDSIFKAIRHSFSHSRKKLTHKPTVTILEELFNDKKIDFNKSKHRKIYNEKFRQLADECEKLLLKELLGKIPKKPNFLDYFFRTS